MTMRVLGISGSLRAELAGVADALVAAVDVSTRESVLV